MPHENTDVVNKNGKITLKGRVDRDNLRVAAENAVRHLKGARDVGDITDAARERGASVEVSGLIRRALGRRATVDTERIAVHTDGSGERPLLRS